MFCPNCGKENRSQAVYCKECGAALNDSTASYGASIPDSLVQYTASVQSIHDTESESNQLRAEITAIMAKEEKKRHLKIIAAIAGGVILISCIGVVVYCSATEFSIETVKKGYINADDSKTMGQLFEGYFYDTDWYFHDYSNPQVEFVGYFQDDCFGGVKASITYEYDPKRDKRGESHLESIVLDDMTELTDSQMVSFMDAVCTRSSIALDETEYPADFVKSSELSSYSEKDMETAFSDFFDACEWRYSAYADAVIFTGYFMSSDFEQIKTTVWFTFVDEEDYRFYLSSVCLESDNEYDYTYLTDSEIESMLNAIYYGGTFSWTWG